jgi:hypothetical protein
MRSLPTCFALELEGSVLDTELRQSRFEFCHDAVAVGQLLVRGEDVRAKGNVTGADAPYMQVMHAQNAGDTCHALSDFFGGEMFGDAFNQNVQ